MTKAKTIVETKRPWRSAGPSLRDLVRCPLCARRGPKVIAYRKSTTRLECKGCAFRFSVKPLDVANALRMRPEKVLEGLAATVSEHELTGLVALAFLMGGDPSEGDMEEHIKTMLRNTGTNIAAGALAKPGDTPEERIERLRPLL